jgi:acyl carrier protein
MRVYLKAKSLFFKTCGVISLRNSLPGSEKRISRMQKHDADIRSRITTLVKSILEQNAVAADVGPDAKLVDVGLTSMDMVNLMLGIEAEFDFMIPQDLITPENFQSVETLERLVAGQLAAAKAA